MVAAVVVVWIVLSILVGLTMAPLRRPSGLAPLRRPSGLAPLRRPSRMHPSSLDPSSLAAPPPGSARH